MKYAKKGAVLLFTVSSIIACSHPSDSVTAPAASGGSGTGAPLSSKATVDEASKGLGLLILRDIDSKNESAIFVVNGRVLSYNQAGNVDTGIISGPQYCIYQHRGAIKKDKFLKLTEVNQGRIATTTGYFQGLIFEFEGGTKLSAPGNFRSSAVDVLFSCLGYAAQFRQLPTSANRRRH